MNRRLIALFFAAVILLSGCAAGSVNPSPGAQQTPSAPQIQPVRPAQPAPQKLVIGIAQDFDSLDPGMMSAAGTLEVMYNVYHGLVNATPGGEIVPELCESFEVGDDLLTYAFKLRTDASFHNGKPLTSADVAYTYNRMMGKTDDQTEPLNAEFAKGIARILTPDDHTIIFELNAPSASFISLCLTGIIPEGSGAEIAKKPVGAGPYRFVSYSPGVGLTLSRFEDYYGDAPFFGEVEFKIFTDTSTVQLALQNGEMQIMKFEESTFTYDKDKLKLVKQPQNMVQMLAFNHQFEPFSVLEVRKAVNYAVDKKQLIAALSPGSPQLDSNFSPVMGFYYNHELLDFYPHDPQMARQLLSDAGYPDLTFSVKVPSEYKFHVDTALILKQQLAQAGITMNIEIIEWNTWLTQVYTEFDHQATIVGLAGKIDPGSVMARPVTGYNRNFFRYSNPEYDRLVGEAAGEGDQNRRADLYRQAQRVAAEDALMVPLMDPGNNLLMDLHIEGYLTYPTSYIDLRSLRWEP